ncbi:hypothetical protein AKJ40_00660 [candidate division MSBL1 archaeon SCGC-AAA259M10]|uniref:Uncharacterized protein n=1 Tax=candidate division MSBL1 archaeon SCGC-AAA259M10 TaxID=1698270 RepID=A0A133V2T9_9EURY|nr:hypothetical protein AKJ40_00660 [candidate division MSBL1 archaeon SCGC-AAA259M10]
MPERRAWSIDIRWKDVMNELPSTVFPIRVSIQCDRSVKDDENWGPWDGVTKTFEVRQPDSIPYIPRQTIYFYNPVEEKRLPGEGSPQTRPGSHIQYKDMCEAEAFFEEFEEFLRTVETDYPEVPERIYIQNLKLVEIPEGYIENGKLQRRDLIEEEQRVSIAEFGRPTKISKKKVRTEIREILADRCLKPLDLTEMLSVVMKPVGKAHVPKRYYTKKKALKHNRPDLQPEIFNEAELENMPREELKGYLEQLIEENILKQVVYEGETVEKKEFVEQTARIEVSS